MAVNSVTLSQADKFVKLPNEQIIYTSPPRIALNLTSGNTFPGSKPVNLDISNGIVYLTTHRLIYLPTTPTSAFRSFSSRIKLLRDTHVTAPFFGPNFWTALIQPHQMTDLTSAPAVQVKITFKEGGAYDYHNMFEQLRERLAQARETAQMRGQTGDDGELNMEDLPAYEPRGGDGGAVGVGVGDNGTIVNEAERSRDVPPEDAPPGYEESVGAGRM